MDNDAAYMAPVTPNAQSGLAALERGLHALHATEREQAWAVSGRLRQGNWAAGSNGGARSGGG